MLQRFECSSDLSAVVNDLRPSGSSEIESDDGLLVGIVRVCQVLSSVCHDCDWGLRKIATHRSCFLYKILMTIGMLYSA